MWYGMVNYKGYTREDAKKSVGDGWAFLIDKVFDALGRIKGTVKIIQVKEKFGGLRVYTDVYNKELEEIIITVGHESYTICEDCGRTGSLREGSWYRTLCDEHANGKPSIQPFWI